MRIHKMCVFELQTIVKRVFKLKYNPQSQLWALLKVPIKRNLLLFYSEGLPKMMKNGVYFIVIELLVAEIVKILIYAN